MLLQNNLRFQQEHQNFTDKINQISNEKVKVEALRLLRELVAEVKRIDHGHQELNFQKQLPDGIDLTRNKLVKIRKQLVKILSESS
jgi:hypothetical protein